MAVNIVAVVVAAVEAVAQPCTADWVVAKVVGLAPAIRRYLALVGFFLGFLRDVLRMVTVVFLVRPLSVACQRQTKVDRNRMEEACGLVWVLDVTVRSAIFGLGYPGLVQISWAFWVQTAVVVAVVVVAVLEIRFR